MGRNQRMRRSGTRLAGAIAVFLFLNCGASWGQTPLPQKTSQSSEKDLTQVSLENLMNMEVTSVSKKEQKLSRVAAAIFVITQEDIRRSGATNIPDLLRTVPGMDAAEINGSTWAIGSRGFNKQFANKLLVLVDGRSVYSPTFSGVIWDTLDLPLIDIERIEVIRGPGGSIWGANAVTGVISIFTKKASETRGVVAEAGAHSPRRIPRRRENMGRLAWVSRSRPGWWESWEEESGWKANSDGEADSTSPRA
jgi:iron complex outermembrane recepter protein